jgi:hypothetical protein
MWSGQRGARYMIDVVMFKQMNPNAFPASRDDEEALPLSALRRTEKPAKGFFLLLPSKVMGFSMQTKRWGWFPPNVPTYILQILYSSFPQSSLYFSCCLEHGGFR